MISKQFLNKVLFNRRSLSVRHYARNINPIKKTLDILSMDMPSLNSDKKRTFTYPEHTDIVVIGGGYIGSAVAYWIKSRAGDGLSVVVLEKDFSVSKCYYYFKLKLIVTVIMSYCNQNTYELYSLIVSV